MNKYPAYEMQKFTQPAKRGFFYARLALITAAIALAAFALTGCDDLQAAHAQAVEHVAAQQDREALSSREWAGQQACGAGKTAVWLDDKTLSCLRETTP